MSTDSKNANFDDEGFWEKIENFAKAAGREVHYATMEDS